MDYMDSIVVSNQVDSTIIDGIINRINREGNKTMNAYHVWLECDEYFKGNMIARYANTDINRVSMEEYKIAWKKHHIYNLLGSWDIIIPLNEVTNKPLPLATILKDIDIYEKWERQILELDDMGLITATGKVRIPEKKQEMKLYKWAMKHFSLTPAGSIGCMCFSQWISKKAGLLGYTVTEDMVYDIDNGILKVDTLNKDIISAIIKVVVDDIIEAIKGCSIDRFDIHISVKPIDLILSSENSVYDSCHSLNINPCHSTANCHGNGNMSYLLDSSTFIAYITRRGDTKKLNRYLLYASHDLTTIIIGRSYPQGESIIGKYYANNVASVLIDKMITYHDIDESDINYFPEGYRVSDILTSFTVKQDSNKHEYDIPYLYDKPMGYIAINNNDPDERKYDIGTDYTFCLICGEKYSSAYSVICPDCGGNSDLIPDANDEECSECGQAYNPNTMTIINNNWICDDCSQQYYFICDDCEEYIHRSSRAEYTVRDANNNIERYVCGDCIDNYHYCDDCREAYVSGVLIEVNRYDTYCPDCYANRYPNKV